MTFKKFISLSLELFSKIKQNATIQECLNTNAQASAAATTAGDPNEPLWFIYYMFFAIHNPKMEDYIQKKTSASASTPTAAAAAHIIKNMIKRRQHTSTIVFELYTHAYTNEGNVSVIYPKDKHNIANQLIKSFHSNHLKTTAVLLRRCATPSPPTPPSTPPSTPPPIHAFIEYIMTTQPTLSTVTTATAVIHKINNQIKYRHKDIIILALTCYMKIDEDDINKKNIFISATPEEENFATTATTTVTTTETTTATDHPFACHPLSLATASDIETPYDYKYKYLYS